MNERHYLLKTKYASLASTQFTSCRKERKFSVLITIPRKRYDVLEKM
jgi:hypothetical protein